MGKLKEDVVSFSFKDHTRQEIVDQLNNENPISIKNQEDLVNRVHSRYPLLDKPEVGIIIKAIFASLRDLLVLGKVLNFNKLFFNMKLFFFTHQKKGAIFPAVKVKVSTTPKIRKI